MKSFHLEIWYTSLSFTPRLFRDAAKIEIKVLEKIRQKKSTDKKWDLLKMKFYVIFSSIILNGKNSCLFQLVYNVGGLVWLSWPCVFDLWKIGFKCIRIYGELSSDPFENWLYKFSSPGQKCVQGLSIPLFDILSG
jgi:hypothetical protein